MSAVRVSGWIHVHSPQPLMCWVGQISQQGFAGERGEAVEILPDDIAVLVRDLGKADADAEARRAVRDFSFGPGLGLPEPEADAEFSPDFQRDCHFDIATAKAEVRYRAPERCATVNVDFDRVLAPIAGMSAALGHASLVRILPGAIEREIPERFAGRDVQHANAPGLRSAGFADPFHAEVDAIRLVGDANDLVNGKVRFDSGELDPSAADVHGDGFLREDDA